MAADLAVSVRDHQQYTLANLNSRSYYLLHEEDESKLLDPRLQQLDQFRQHLRKAVLLANVELVVIRNCQLNGLQADTAVKLDAAEGLQGLDADEHENALRPIVSLLEGNLTQSRASIATRMEAEDASARAVIHKGQGLQLSGYDEEGLKAQLNAVTWTLAAYQPALLDLGSTGGNQSPFQEQHGIAQVEEQVVATRTRALARGPELLAKLSMELLLAVRGSRQELGLPLASYLLQAASMSGHYELVRLLCPEIGMLLPNGNDGTQSRERRLQAEKRIITGMLRAWIGYQGYGNQSLPFKPLQPGRTQGHKTDWLNFKGSLARAVLIAHDVIGMLMVANGIGGGQTAEFTEDKWQLVTVLFERPDACKPLALAMMHYVAAKRSQLLNDRQQPADLAVDPAIYASLHRLAVQAGHLAAHSTSLSTVSAGLTCIKAVQAWPEVNLEMLTDLAEAFPQECVRLLKVIPLEDVDLQDNVLPFTVPPGFRTVAVSDKNQGEFCREVVNRSMNDAANFSTQLAKDATIEASLLVFARIWLSLIFLFMPSEFRSPTVHLLLRIFGGSLAAFASQGPGSIAVMVLLAAIVLVMAVVSRAVIMVLRFVYWCILHRPIAAFVHHVLGYVAQKVEAAKAVSGADIDADAGGAPSGQNGKLKKFVSWSSRTEVAPGTTPAASLRPPCTAPPAAAVDGGGGPSGQRTDALSTGKKFLMILRHELWRVFSHGHYKLINMAVGWNTGHTTISCRKVPMPLVYGGSHTTDSRNDTPGSKYRRQWDTLLLEKLLKAPGVQPPDFGNPVLRALILFKWNQFTKRFLILQLSLHICYMGIFLAYASTISSKDMEPVDGRQSGWGSKQDGCQLPAPTKVQMWLLLALAVMTSDFIVQEIRQMLHFGLRYFTYAWDLIDLFSITLVVITISLHFSCTLHASPAVLRGLVAVEILLLFMRLSCFAMSTDKIGSFVRMVLAIIGDLALFFVFLAVVLVGFALAMITSQGKLLADDEDNPEKHIFAKLFTMTFGDFDVDFLTKTDTGSLGSNSLTGVIASAFMIMVTIILLNLLISIISESYDHIRLNEQWELLRSKALLVVECEAQVAPWLLRWLYRVLLAPKTTSDEDDGKRFLYVIAHESARPVVDPAAAGGEDAKDNNKDDNGDDGTDDKDDAQEGNSRLGVMKRTIKNETRALASTMRKGLEEIKSRDQQQQSQQLQQLQQQHQQPQHQQQQPYQEMVGPLQKQLQGIIGQVEQMRQEQMLQQKRTVQELVAQLTTHVNTSVQNVQDQLQQVQLQLDKHAAEIKARQGYGGGPSGPSGGGPAQQKTSNRLGSLAAHFGLQQPPSS